MTKALRFFRRDIRAIPMGIKLIVLVIFLRSFGWGFVDPYWSIYLKQFTENYTLVGVFSALLSFASLITIIPLIRLADRMKETVLIRDAELLYFFVILAYILSGLLRSIPLLLLTMVLSGVAHTLLTIGTESYIRKHDGKGKAGPFAYYVALDYFGWIIGMIIAAYTVQYYTLNTMFLFVLPAVIFSFFILPHIHERGIKSLLKGFKRYFHSGRDLSDIFKDCRELSPKMVFFFLLAFFDGAIRMFSLIFIPLFALSIDLDFKAIAFLMAAMYFPFIMSFFFSELSDRMRKMNVIATGLFIGGISFVSLYFIVDKFWVVAFAAAISLSMAIVRPAYNGMITRLAPRRMLGEVTSLNNFADRLGRIVGPVLAGLVADAYGLPLIFLLTAIVAFGLGLMSLALRSYDLLTNVDGKIVIE